jgi:phosphoglycolate phosphatase
MTALFIDNREALSDLEMIMLDKDGTIIDIHHYWGSMITKRADLIVETYITEPNQQIKLRNELVETMGIDLLTGKMKPEGPVGIKPREYIVQVATEVLLNSRVTQSPEDIEKIFRTVDSNTASNITPLLTVLPFAEDFLIRCSKHNVQLAVVTTDKRERAETALKALNIDHYFQYVIGGDEVENVKPAADMANKVLEISGLSKEKVAVIGDHPVDVQMGLAAGIECNVGVLTGLGKNEDFRKLPCWIVNSFENLDIQ